MPIKVPTQGPNLRDRQDLKDFKILSSVFTEVFVRSDKGGLKCLCIAKMKIHIF